MFTLHFLYSHLNSAIINFLTEVTLTKGGGQSLCNENHELLHQCTRILSSRSLVTSDVVFHRNILKLLSYLIQNAKTKSKLEAEYKELAENSHELLTHCLVVLNIIQHLIEATTPISQAPKSQVDQTSITNPRLVSKQLHCSPGLGMLQLNLKLCILIFHNFFHNFFRHTLLPRIQYMGVFKGLRRGKKK